MHIFGNTTALGREKETCYQCFWNFIAFFCLFLNLYCLYGPVTVAKLLSSIIFILQHFSVVRKYNNLRFIDRELWQKRSLMTCLRSCTQPHQRAGNSARIPNSRQMLQPLGWPFAPVFRELKRFCPDFRDGSEIIEGRLAKITEYLDQVKMSCLGGELQYQEDSKLCFSLIHSCPL